MDVLRSSLKENQKTILVVHSQLSTYDLPLSLLNLTGADRLDAGAVLIIRMDKAKSQQEQLFEQAISKEGLKHVSDMIDYKVILKSKDKEEEINILEILL